jgi:hypothetical protein
MVCEVDGIVCGMKAVGGVVCGWCMVLVCDVDVEAEAVG